jgi:NADH-quinone oxidoreductase subunit C
MTPQEIFEHLKSKFGDSILELKSDKPVDPFIIIKPDKIDEICFYLRDYADFQFDELCLLSGVDFADGNLGVVYHLYSLPKRHKVTLKVIIPKDTPNVKTVSGVWATADWHEREAYDMIGIIFDGHKYLRRILLDDDWVGHPLRKDFEVPEFYHGMKVPY